MVFKAELWHYISGCGMFPVMARTKDPAAVSLGRRGGQRKVPKGFSTMSPSRRAEIAKKAAEARWGKKKGKGQKGKAGK
jgi:hypothetical protein